MKEPDFKRIDAAIDHYQLGGGTGPPLRSLLMQSWRGPTGSSICSHQTPPLLTSAEQICEVALRLAPDLAEAHLALASIFEFSGNPQGALREIARALSLDQSDPSTLVWQAAVYTRLNRWEDAEKTLHRVLKEHPNNFIAYNELGRELHGQGKYQEATQAYRAASLAAPRSAVLLSNLGGECLQIGEFAEGTETLKKSVAPWILTPIPRR